MAGLDHRERMQTIKHSAARLGLAATLAIGLTWGLSACGGGGGEDEPDFAVTATVQGDTAPGTTLAAGQSATLSVPSGATLVFSSEGETRWTHTPTDASFTVDSFSWTSKQLTVQSNGGGSVVIVFTGKDDDAERSTLTVNVAPRRFDRVAKVLGEREDWSDTVVTRAGTTQLNSSSRVVTSIEADESYWVDRSFARYLYDAADRLLRSEFTSGRTCNYAYPVEGVSYPLYVGKSWTQDNRYDCSDDSGSNSTAVRTVEAFESVEVPAGAFGALRIRSSFSITNDSSVPGGAHSSEQVCWWAINIGRYVKCESVLTYPDGVPDYHARTLASVLVSRSVP
jgi:hypothetical protein